MKILVLGLGNDLIADDGLGIHVVRQLQNCFPDQVDVVETAAAGIALLEMFIGYDKAIIVDAVKTGKTLPGTIHEWKLEELSEVVAPSPHYAGLPEILALANRLELDYPKEFAIFSMEAGDPYTIGKGLTKTIEDSIPQMVDLVEERIGDWMGVNQPLMQKK